MYLKNHCENVQALSFQVGLKIELSLVELVELSSAALLHDIGKIKIPLSITNKPTSLSYDEYEIMKKHSVYSSEILRDSGFNQNIIDAVLYHHERYDGSGYPGKLKGSNIPLYSRIISLCDAFDCMISKRSYKNPYTFEKALYEIEYNMGSQFDPLLAKVFLEVLVSDNLNVLIYGT